MILDFTVTTPSGKGLSLSALAQNDNDSVVKHGDFKISKSLAIFGANYNNSAYILNELHEFVTLMRGNPCLNDSNKHCKYSICFLFDNHVFTYNVEYNIKQVCQEILLNEYGEVIFDRKHYLAKIANNKLLLERLAEQHVTNNGQDIINCDYLTPTKCRGIWNYLQDIELYLAPRIVADIRRDILFVDEFVFLNKLRHTINNGGVIVINKLSNYFHTLEVDNLIRSFYSSCKNCQLIFTTQDAMLLDESLFERDQIYFAHKDDDKTELELYPLSAFNDIKDNANLPAEYLTGNFGAIPYCKTSDWLEDF